MKKLAKLSLVLVLLVSAIAFTGCKKKFPVHIFSSEGGYVTVNDNSTVLSKEILYFNSEKTLTLQAHPNNGYQFMYWLVDTKIYSSEDKLIINVDKEIVIKAVFDNSGSYYITYYDENGTIIGKEAIESRGIIKNMPNIPQKEGYIGKFFCGDVEVNNGDTFQYSTNKDFRLVYVKKVYTISTNSSTDYSITAVTGYSWNVKYGEDFKFECTPNSGVSISRVSVENITLTPDNQGIYTIKNVKKDLKIEVEITTDDPEEQITFYTVQLDQQSSTDNFSFIQATNYTNLENEANKRYRYLVPEGNIFVFVIGIDTNYSRDNLEVRINGINVSPYATYGDYTNEYRINNIYNDIFISVTIKKTFTMNFSIDYGKIDTFNYFIDMLADLNTVLYETGTISYNYTELIDKTNGTTQITGLKSIELVNEENSTSQSTFFNFIKEINQIELNTISTYKVVSISLTQTSTNKTIDDWCTIHYENINSSGVLTFASNSFDITCLDDIIITLNWDTTDNIHSN